MRHLLAPLTLFALTLPAAAQSTWVLDAAGSGDFTDLQTAIDAVDAGDVLLVLPGSYGEATLSKALTLLGDPDQPEPHVAGLDVQGAPRATLVHLELDRLRLVGVAGTAVVDDCNVGPGPSWAPHPQLPLSAFAIQGCGDVRLSRTAIESAEVQASGLVALRVSAGSRVQLADCDLRGADAPADSGLFLWGVGGTALIVEEDSHVWIAGSTLQGGDGEDLWTFFEIQPGYGGDALLVGPGCRVDVRGSSADALVAGFENPGFSGTNDGLAIDCFGLGASDPPQVTTSGVLLSGGLSTCSSPTPAPWPVLTVGGLDGPGLVRRAQLRGAEGEPALLLLGFESAVLDVALVQEAPLWLSPSSVAQVQPAILLGLEVAVTFTWTQPPTSSLAGLEASLQAFQLLPVGTALGTNAGSIVLSF